MTDGPILVTGAAGFIGFHVAQRLLRNGRDVIGLDKAAVSRSVRGMKAAGNVDLQRSGGEQIRQAIALTRKGLALHDRIVKLSLARERQLLKGFSAAERKLLINFLSRMHGQVVDTNATEMQR